MNSLSSKPFAKKFFYIDLKGFPNEKKLIRDLELLGGKQEVFLSKTVSFVVSNRISLAESGSPSTPVSNTKSISPYFFKDSSLDNRDSPASNSPGFEQRVNNEPVMPLSRGMSVLQKAREKCQGNNKFILDICKQWNIKVYPVQKVLSWIEKYKYKYYKHSTSKSKQELTSENITRLYSPFSKIEDKQRNYKPRYKVFTSWSESIDPVLLQNVNKLTANFKQFGNVDFSARTPLKEIFRQPQTPNLSEKTTCITQAMEYSASKGTGYNSSKAGGYCSSKVAGYNSISNSVSVGGPGRKQIEKGSRSLKSKKERHAKKKKLFCEICGVHYSDGEAHYEKNPHARFLNDSANYEIVHKEIDALPTVDDFLSSILANEKDCEEVDEVFEDSPTEAENCKEVNIDKCPKSNENHGADTCMTEVYTLNENDYISASYSSVSSPLPYLEKTEDVRLTKDVDLAPPVLVNSNFAESRQATFRSLLNPPLLLSEYYDASLGSIANSLHVTVTQNLDKITCTQLENNPDPIADECLVEPIHLSQNFIEDDSVMLGNENIIQNGQINPANLAQDFIDNAQGNENASYLEQAQNFLQQPVINLNDKNVEQPLDLSNYSMNNEKIILNGQMFVNDNSINNMKNHNILNDNSSCAVSNLSLISTHVDSKRFANVLGCDTVNEKSEAESFDSEPNLAGFDAIINNCLEEVNKSLVDDTSTAEEDGPINELQCQNSNIVEFISMEFTANGQENKESKSIISHAEFIPVTQSFQEHLVENPTINQKPNGKLTEYPDTEHGVICTSVNETISDFCHSPVETTTLFLQEFPVAVKEETESPLSITDSFENQNESMFCIKDTTKSSEKFPSLNQSENPERLNILGFTSSYLKSIQAKVPPELLHSDDAYLVLDEADSSFNSVKDEHHAKEINNSKSRILTPNAVANIEDSFESEYKVTGIEDKNETMHIEFECASNGNCMKKTAENFMCNIIQSQSVDQVDGKENEVISECNHKHSLDSIIACEVKEGVHCSKIVNSFTNAVCEIQEQEIEEKRVACAEGEFPYVIKKDDEDAEHGMDYSDSDCFNKLPEKETEKTDYHEMKSSSFNAVNKNTEQIDSTQIKVHEPQDKEEIYCNKMEYSITNTVNKTLKGKICNNIGKYLSKTKENDTTDCNVGSFSVKRESESKEPVSKKMKISLNDSITDQKSLNVVEAESFNSTVMNAVSGKDTENNTMKHSSVAETAISLEPHLHSRQFCENSDVNSICCANDCVNSYSSSCESSFCNSNESNTSLIEGILPCYPVADGVQDTEKPVHIVYLSTPIHPNNSIPVKQESTQEII